MIPVTIAASMAFMFPIATHSRFSSGKLRMLDMFKAGLIINIIGIMVVIVFYYGDFSL
jgi:sodium-dependent dicarboxylate transporter 2/3/5